MGTLPSGTAGSAISSQLITGFEVLDAANQQITGPFSQNVTVSSNNAAVTLCQLQLGNCSAATTTVTLTSGTQILAMNYSGAVVNPVKITASAPGATSNSVTFAPPIPPIVYSGPTNSSTGQPEIDLYAPSGTATPSPGSTFTFSATEAGYTGASFNNSILASVPSGCNAFATVTQTSPTSFTVTAIAAPSAGSCTVTLSGFGGPPAVTQTVTLTYSTLGVTLQ
jgi:hypothetical protein